MRARWENGARDQGPSDGPPDHFYDDPAAPEANSIVPSVKLRSRNPAGQLLFIGGSDTTTGLPGGRRARTSWDVLGARTR